MQAITDGRIARGHRRYSKVLVILRGTRRKSAEKREISRKSPLTPQGGAHMVRPLGARSSVVEHLTFNQRVDGSIPSGLTSLPDFLACFPARTRREKARAMAAAMDNGAPSIRLRDPALRSPWKNKAESRSRLRNRLRPPEIGPHESRVSDNRAVCGPGYNEH